MSKISLSPQFYRIHKMEVVPIKEKTSEKSAFVKSIISVRNSLIKLADLFITSKPAETSVAHFHRGSASEGRAVITKKIVKDFMLQKLNELEIKSNAGKDPAYARQTREAMLSAVFSNNKDRYCKLLLSQGKSIAPFLKDIGMAAQNAGLPGDSKNDIFTPSGAGANPFITPLLSSANARYPQVFLNQNQQASLKAYAETIIMKEVTPLFKESGMPTPQQFQVMLESIANKHIQNAS
ncbi:type III secretion system guanine nucleotide exchange factor SopE2 [Salmonella enterica subsp. salamae]|nr:type III secretion system guanine nucleotide exchange factor SopE2 [Salmonella enterica subsp. salamae]ECJ2280325.1 type III secretion system guanine nucleotide exchange factor SopE2 [Salmonella enterica subsp. salamae]